MIDDVSPAVERALEAAKKQAGNAPLNAVHLFLALIEEDEGRAAQVLVEAGGDLAAVREAFAAHPAHTFDMPAVLTGAREVAGERDETTVTGEYLLVGLVRASERFHVPLSRAGVQVERLVRPAAVPPIHSAEPPVIPDTFET